MTITQILDIVMPYTKEELRCGRRKKVKMEQRNRLADLIYKYKRGEEIQLPENVLQYLNINQNAYNSR